MKRSDYPRLIKTHNSDKGIKRVLVWESKGLIVPIFEDVNNSDDLYELLFDGGQELHTKLTENFINVLIVQYEKYNTFKSQITLEEMCDELRFPRQEYLPQIVIDFFQKHMCISLDTPLIKNGLAERHYKYGVVKVEDLTIIALHDWAAFAINDEGELLIIREDLYFSFVRHIREVINHQIPMGNTDDYRFPLYIETLDLTENDDVFVYIDKEFISYDDNHACEPTFKRVGKPNPVDVNFMCQVWNPNHTSPIDENHKQFVNEYHCTTLKEIVDLIHDSKVNDLELRCYSAYTIHGSKCNVRFLEYSTKTGMIFSVDKGEYSPHAYAFKSHRRDIVHMLMQKSLEGYKIANN